MMEQRTMLSLVDQIRGVSYKPTDLHDNLNGDSITLLRANNIDDGKINFDEVVYVDRKCVSKSQLLRKGDILICASSGSRHLVGKAAQVDFEGEYTFGAFCKVVRPRLASDAGYIGMFFQSPIYKRTIAEKAQGININNIRAEHIDSMAICWPDQIDRQKAVETYQAIRDCIRLRQRQLRTLDTLIKARFVEMFGDITETVPLSFYIESLTAGKSLAGEEECQYKVLKTGAATYDYFDPLQVKNLPIDYWPLPEHQIHDGDVIISRMNTAELVGAAAYVWKAPEHTYLPDRLWRAELTDKANPIFVWQAIVQPTTKSAIRRIAGGTSGSMKNISKLGLLSLRVKKVDLAQQDQFAAFVSQVDKSKLLHQRSFHIHYSGHRPYYLSDEV